LIIKKNPLKKNPILKKKETIIKYPEETKCNEIKNFIMNKRKNSFHIVTYSTQIDNKNNEKNEFLQKIEDENLIEKNKKMLNCPKCGWIFPKNMNLKRIDIHINKCLDGFGEEDKIRYEIYRKYNKLTLRETDIYICCPICNKNFSKIKNPKIKYCHVQECLKRLNKKDFIKRDLEKENCNKEKNDVKIDDIRY
jgi:uncharacterized C2H2 Zn-finger protein